MRKNITIISIMTLIILTGTLWCAQNHNPGENEVMRKTIITVDDFTHIIYYKNGREIAREWVDKNAEITRASGNIPDGKVKEYYKSGKLKSEETYKNDKREGIAKRYYKSGKLKAEWTFKNDKREGIAKTYYESGKLEAEGTYKNDKREGIAKTYYESGKLEAEGTYKNDKLEGIAKTYYESGKLEAEGTYKNDKLEGIEKTYYESGKLKSEGTYKNGHIDVTTITDHDLITLIATDPLSHNVTSGIRQTRYVIDPQAVNLEECFSMPLYSQQSFTLSIGTHTVYYLSTDNVGNEEAIKSATVVVR